MKAFRIFCIALLGIAVCSCTPNAPSFNLSDLQGLWQENNTEHFVRFTTEQSDEAGYLYGREWDEAEDIYEEDLLPHGNGWFKYLFETNGNLTEIHLMNNGGAEIPKVYIVSKLTSTTLEYYEKDHKSISFSFQKMVEK
ncbi:MAG: hypothetical protein IKD12_03230 [Paludibacteraceae bacterium]|nr:hypothetical protein [Paludibacteraceae bacterium]